MKQLRVLATIPARGGSKSIPKKNIYNLGGKPLIAYTIEEALKSKYITDLIVSTDDEDIANISKQYGAQVPFIRPEDLSNDMAQSYPVVVHALEYMENLNDCEYDVHIMLQPTSPFRKAEHIDKSLELLLETTADTVVTVCNVGASHPLRMKKMIGKENYLVNYIDQGFENMKPRQTLPDVYIRNGAVYTSTRDSLYKHKSLVGDDCRGYIMTDDESVNIDSWVDMKIAEFLVSESNFT